ncbi:hypothetical protein NBRGN_045_00470 [Nocardia brasiliensis NBRC 14402]|uniref:hypothetical protein n=1 Tax=Nocardia brasiliensis TaxID=37326 RepID=UPI0002EC97C6|nr:hypothetical protein [Nocardia brasiliensis]ASF09846.1 hypothetical protein CEQ30_23585 [Nocardia brasiliensis]GAJ81947.1 hypothetical protein NBRGN_045_00470 [Nocardia brasiliensis NBRC 14402]SUB55079.1 Uncharacterised protein [Nocardia brasiliensis]
MSEKYYPAHTSGADDDVTMCHSTSGSFRVAMHNGRVHVYVGSAFMLLELDKATLLRGLLDAGIADALAYLADSADQVDLAKAVA